MIIAIHSKTFDPQKLPFIRQVIEEISKKKVQLRLSEDCYAYLKQMDIKVKHHDVFSHYSQLDDDVDLMISVGGDGTFLESTTLVRHHNIPILGINIGRLGFLATISKDNIKHAIDAVYNGFYSIEERSLLMMESDPQLFGDLNFGMNEFTITKRDTASMIIVHTYMDGEYLNSYWADGLIVSTPTGSTAYSLSVGGPVVIPQTNNFIVAPISPHNLNVRPLIVSDNCVLSFEIEGRSKNYLVSLDSRSIAVEANVQIAVHKADFTSKLIKLNGDNFLNTLRAKLNWGLDTRN